MLESSVKNQFLSKAIRKDDTAETGSQTMESELTRISTNQNPPNSNNPPAYDQTTGDEDDFQQYTDVSKQLLVGNKQLRSQSTA